MTAYHPQSNGLIERLHISVKVSLRCHLMQRKSWVDSLPFAPGISTSLKEDIGYSSAEILYGSSLRLPGEFFLPEFLTSSTRNSFKGYKEQYAR
ncbi:integrase catalytic domain-containing protein [Trichonephila clavata]|uniref:Integrase catalytic domain-containing protein n=1 Tax=Trichonephila clavata TaxID=2740835 RepID=A0A8X6HXL7_TRICU|nr:integrase catalytic domain-containing protein [Trichonephila clavata]